MYSVLQESSHLKNKWFAVNELKQAKLLEWFVKMPFFPPIPFVCVCVCQTVCMFCSECVFVCFCVCVCVCRSSDYGSTYTKLADQAGRTLLSYLYVCPTNKQKVGIFLFLLFLLSLWSRPSPAQHRIIFLSKLLSNDGTSPSDATSLASLCTLDNDPQRPGGRERRAHQLRWRCNLWKASH